MRRLSWACLICLLAVSVSLGQNAASSNAATASLPEVVSHWFSGVKLQEGTSLFGVSLLWWGRVGKLMQFVAALTILAEIVGPQRLHAFGRSLRGVSLSRFLRGMFEKHDSSSNLAFGMYVLLLLLLAILITPYLAEHWFKPEMLKIQIGSLSFPLPQSDPQYASRLRTAWIYSAISSLLLCIPMLGLAMELFGRVADWLIRGLAWALGKPNLDKIVKVASAILLFVGFSLDLLTS